jgi:hypothetical protein
VLRFICGALLNMRRSASRRPGKEWDVPGVEPPEPTDKQELFQLSGLLTICEVAWPPPSGGPVNLYLSR